MKGRRESHHARTGVLNAGELDRIYDPKVVEKLKTERQIADYLKNALADAGESRTRISVILDIATQARERIKRDAKHD
jgi:DNA-binding phage protein